MRSVNFSRCSPLRIERSGQSGLIWLKLATVVVAVEDIIDRGRERLKNVSKALNALYKSPSRAPRHDVRFYNFFNFCKIFLEIICY